MSGRIRARAVQLGGGYDQLPLTRALRELECEITLIDYTENPPCAGGVDRHVRESWADTDVVAEAVNSDGADVIATCSIDAAQTVAADVAAATGAHFPLSPGQAHDTTNKTLMKETMVQAGVPTGRFELVQDSRSLHQWSVYPAVLKAVKGSGSQGVRLVQNAEDAKGAYTELSGLCPGEGVLVEEYLPGTEITIDSLVVGGHSQVVMISENVTRTREHETACISTSYDPRLHQRHTTAARALCQQIVDAFSLTDTPMMVQAKDAPDGLQVIELSARIGGGFKSRLIQRVTGVDLPRCQAQLLLGTAPAVTPSPTTEYVSMNYIMGDTGRFGSVKNIDRALSKGLIEEYLPARSPGDEISGEFNARSRVGAFLASGSTQDELRDRCRRARDLLVVTSDSGEDMTRRWSV